jgi:hypothetical protein
MVEIKIVPWRIALILLFGLGALLSIYMGFVSLRMRFGYDYVYGLGPLFDWDRAPNIPSWYKALLFVAAAAVSVLAAALVEHQVRWQKLHWYAIAAVMIALSLNESAELQEPMAKILTAITNSDRNFAAAWIFAYLGGAAALGLISLRLLWQLPAATTVLLIAAGAIYLVGAVAMEFAGVAMIEEIAGVAHAELTETHRSLAGKNWRYVIEVATEETLEMLGPILYSTAVLSYLSRSGRRLRIFMRLAPAGGAAISDLLQPRRTYTKEDT